ncbi:MAG: hypothetical protein GY708_05350 [Actinomycetia bacterium]|nr:hypothetical protein [Actinomycetes bacterium]MCP4962722.1 hypothetical protein [Actinomycetes bacterium]
MVAGLGVVGIGVLLVPIGAAANDLRVKQKFGGATPGTMNAAQGTEVVLRWISLTVLGGYLLGAIGMLTVVASFFVPNHYPVCDARNPASTGTWWGLCEQFGDDVVQDGVNNLPWAAGLVLLLALAWWGDHRRQGPGTSALPYEERQPRHPNPANPPESSLPVEHVACVADVVH